MAIQSIINLNSMVFSYESKPEYLIEIQMGTGDLRPTGQDVWCGSDTCWAIRFSSLTSFCTKSSSEIIHSQQPDSLRDFSYCGDAPLAACALSAEITCCQIRLKMDCSLSAVCGTDQNSSNNGKSFSSWCHRPSPAMIFDCKETVILIGITFLCYKKTSTCLLVVSMVICHFQWVTWPDILSLQDHIFKSRLEHC